MTKIQWTDTTWNPVTGCTPISEGCQNCYAKKMAIRLKHMPHTKHKYRNGFNVNLHYDELNTPFSYGKPRKVFTCSMGDLFHDEVPNLFIDKVLTTMAQNPQHTFQVLTKRPKRMLAYWHSKQFKMVEKNKVMLQNDITNKPYITSWPLPNLWVGVTAENQEQANNRIPLLLKINAPVRFVSLEPILQEINLHRILFDTPYTPPLPINPASKNAPDWIIIGGETGPKGRPASPGWFTLIQFQCYLAGIPFFFKQSGSRNKFNFNDVDMFFKNKFREFPQPTIGNLQHILHKQHL